MQPVFLNDDVNNKNRKTKRILELKAKEGKGPKNTSGVTDSRLFTGENELYAILDEQTMLWGFKYKIGGLPEPLKQKYTSFDLLLTAAKRYYNSRNIDVVRVID